MSSVAPQTDTYRHKNTQMWAKWARHTRTHTHTDTLVARAEGNLVVDEVVEGDDGADER
jgi:hypothetical protein